MQIEIPDEYFTNEELTNTPLRIARFMQEWKSKKEFNFTVFNNENYDQMILLKDIEFASLCAHHLLPFHGKVHIGYIPDKKICGISKLARVVDMFASKPQIQEGMTQEIADFLQ
jgi:GTP cyclohydrolase I